MNRSPMVCSPQQPTARRAASSVSPMRLDVVVGPGEPAGRLMVPGDLVMVVQSVGIYVESLDDHHSSLGPEAGTD